MHLETGRPLSGEALERLKAFLAENGLRYDPGIQFTALLMEDGEIQATGSLDGATLKCIAVRPSHQGEGLTAPLMTALRQEAFARGIRHLMLFTKPGNEAMFREFGFYPILRTGDCLLMENLRDGLRRRLLELAQGPTPRGTVGAVVANCNPFTLGHRHLIETAAAACDRLLVFILSENRGMFTPMERLAMARAGCADLSNVRVLPTGPYLISSATFPDYFIKDRSRVDEVRCEVDVRMFAERFAPALHITKRFVGEEPLDARTRAYNETLKRELPAYGIEVTEIPRKTADGEPISASRVRAQIAAGQSDGLDALVPESTLNILLEKYPNLRK